MKKKKNDSMQSLEAFIDEHIGQRGNPDREAFEVDYAQFKIGVLIQQAREEKGLTQEELK